MKPETLKENLEDLLDIYYRNDLFESGLSTINNFINSGDKNIELLSRRKIGSFSESERKTMPLNSVRSVLDLFSILELAISFGYIASTLPDDVLDKMESCMDSEVFRGYIVNEYKSILPLNLLNRSRGVNDKFDDELTESQVIFIKLLDIDLSWKDDRPLNTFLRYEPNRRIRILRKIISDQERLEKTINGRAGNLPTRNTQNLLFGYFNFLHILENFEELADECNELPYAEGLITSYFASFFDLADLDSITELTKELFYEHRDKLQLSKEQSLQEYTDPDIEIKFFEERIKKLQSVYSEHSLFVN